MSATKVAISMDETLLQRLDRLVKTRSFRSRSQVVQEAVTEKISRMDKSALVRECAKLDRKSEQAMADEGLAFEISGWPQILRGDIYWADLDPTKGHDPYRRQYQDARP